MAVLSSCFARVLYSSMVRAKVVREAERVPSAAGVGCCCWGWEGSAVERAERVVRIVVRCLSAELKVVFWWRRRLEMGEFGKGELVGREMLWDVPCWRC